MGSFSQKILLSGNDYDKSFGVCSSSVDIIASTSSAIQTSGKSSSNSLMASPLVSYNWEYRYYSFKVLASHTDSGIIAWLIRGNQSKAFVRITHLGSPRRSLLKDFETALLTLDFSLYKVPILAVLSFDGVLRIFHVDTMNTLLITVNLSNDDSSIPHCTLKWGPKPTNPEEYKDTSLLLALAINEKVYIIDLNGIAERLSSEPLDFDSASAFYHSRPRILGEMLVQLTPCDTNVETMDFSTDFSTLFIGSDSGKISMYKLSDIASGFFNPFQTWTTSDVSSLSALYYVNFKGPAAPSGYLIGGSKFNRELRLYRVHDFTLVQSIRFSPDEESSQGTGEILRSSPQPMLITQYHSASNLLFASDIKRTVLYMLHLSRDSDNQKEIRFQCISELLLTTPCIAFDVSRVSRSLTIDLPFEAYDSRLSDNIEADITLIHPKELTTGKLSFFVPLSVYLQKGQDIKELHQITDFPLDKDPLTTMSDNCSSPVVPEVDKVSAFAHPMNVFKNLLNRKSSSSSQPTTSSQNFLQSVEDNLSPEISGTHESESMSGCAPPDQKLDESGVNNAEEVLEKSYSLKKSYDSMPENMNSTMGSLFNRSTPSPHVSEVSLPNAALDPSQMSFRGFDGSTKPTELTDSVRSLAGSSSAASLSNYLYRDSSVVDFSRPPTGPMHNVFTKAKGLSMAQELSDSVRSLDGKSTDGKITPGPMRSTNTPSITPNPLGDGPSGASGDGPEDGEMMHLLKSLLSESKAQANMIRMLMTKVQENANQLEKLASMQNVILAQAGPMNLSHQPSSYASAPPAWAKQILDQIQKQKAESAKQLTQLETSLASLQLASGATVSAAANVTKSQLQPQAVSPSPVDNKQQLQGLKDYLRGVVKSELHNLFQSNSPKIIEPLRQSLRSSLEEILNPLPKAVADQMITVINAPTFVQYLTGQMGTAIAPSLATAYRDELRRILVPAFSKGVDSLTKELNELVKTALNQHLQSVIQKMDSGVQSTRDKIEASTRKFDEQINRLSKEITTKIATKMNEAMKGLTQQQQKQQLPLPAPQPQLSQLPLMDSAAFSATSPGEMYSGELLRNAPPISGMFPKNGNSSGGDRQPLGGYSTPLDPYQTALRFIQNQCYEEALEVAVASANQVVLLKVLKDVPIVQLFRQNVKQELLVSLIQQISCGNLEDQLEMKIPFLQEAVNHLRISDPDLLEVCNKTLTNLVSKISILRNSGKMSAAEENRALGLIRTIQEKFPFKGLF